MLTIETQHHWQFLYQRCNWYDFNFVHLSFENDTMFGNFYVSAWLLGFGVRLVWHYKDTDAGHKIAAQIAYFDAE